MKFTSSLILIASAHSQALRGGSSSCGCKSINVQTTDEWCNLVPEGRDCMDLVTAFPTFCQPKDCDGTSSPVAAPTSPPTTSAPVASPTSPPVASPTSPPVASPTSSPGASPTSPPIDGECCYSLQSHIEDNWCQASCTALVAAFPETCAPKACSDSPTMPPTSPPAASPTSPPVASPTSPPVASPTSPPAASPTSAPAASPTSPPVASPTSPPAASPTSPPVASPTSPPVASPTSAPAASPTTAPTAVAAPTPSGNPSVGAEMQKHLSERQAAFDEDVLLYQTPTSQWAPSAVYKFADLLTALHQMWNDGVGAKKLWVGDDYKYALVNVAAFLSQSMKETIKYDACDENSWDLIDGRYPASNSCGQLGQSYQDYTCGAGEEHMQCAVDPTMAITASTNAKWYGAPGPMKCAPKSKLPSPGYWDHTAECNKPWASPPEYCTEYGGQKAGKWVEGVSAGNFNGRTDVEGCCWWGRGVIQTSGICNFGKLNYYIGARAQAEGRKSAYPDINFCKTPDAICSSTEYPELKWIAGLFYWAESVQTYGDRGEGWNYLQELRKFVDGGMQNAGTDAGFIHAVSGIVNRGCHSPPCGTGALDGGAERAKNFKTVLQAMDLI